MIEAETHRPLEITAVDRLPLGGEKIVLQIRGRWRGEPHPGEEPATLVVERGGRREQFPSIPQPRRPRLGRPEAWTASFAVPASVDSGGLTRARVVLGKLESPVPAALLGGGAPAPAKPEAPPAPAPPPPAAAPPPAPRPSFETTLGRLRTELRERAALEATLRGELADAHAELEARTANQDALRAAQAQLRAELEDLSALVREAERRAQAQRRDADLDAQVARLERELQEARAAREALAAEHAREVRRLEAGLAASEAAREAAASAAAALEAELERLGAELATARAELGGEGSGLAEAQALLAEARALKERMRDEAAAVEGPARP